MRTDALKVEFYVARLSDDDLDAGQRAALAMYDHGPRFCAWLDNVFANERVRRLRQYTGEQIEVEYLLVPAHEYTNTDLTQALAVVTALSYRVREQLLGEFIDKLVRVIVIAVGARLKLLEEVHGTDACTV